MRRQMVVGMVCVVLVLGCGLVAQAGVIISEDFAGPGTFEELGWYNKQGWSINNDASRAEENGTAANGWQWIEKSFDDSQVAQGWQLDFDYEWQWGSQAAYLQFQAELINPGAHPDGADGGGYGYCLRVRQGGSNSFQLYKLTSSGPTGTLLAEGDGYSDSGCQFGSPVWKAVRLTWDAATNTLTAYKKVDGEFVEVLSAVDSSYTDFGKLRFNEVETYGEKNWITNIEFQDVPEPATMGLLAVGGLGALWRKRR